MLVVEYIVKILEKSGIHKIFGYQGGNITYLIDAIGRSENIKYVQTYHEQGAAFAANAYAQTTENFGVAISSSGPGAINLINGIANAFYDSIPCLFITGNINSETRRKSNLIRQNGFQETDIVNIVQGITKYATVLDDENYIQIKLEKAIHCMMEGRKGPVLIDIPHDIQRKEIQVSLSNKKINNVVKENINKENPIINQIISLLETSQRPSILVGGGCRDSFSKNLLCDLLKKVHIPVVSSLCGIDVVPDYEYYYGMIGSYGHPWSNYIMEHSDLIIVLGSRLDERQCLNPSTFAGKAKVIRVDIDPVEIERNIESDINYLGNCKDFLYELVQLIKTTIKYEYWNKEILCKKQEQEKLNYYALGENANKIIQQISIQKKSSVICVDVGLHQMAVAQAVKLKDNTKYLNSCGLGSMGYALPASIGAAYATNKTKPILCFVGDGGFAMNLQELQVIIRDKLPILIVVINNNKLAMISSYQKLAFEGRVFGSEWGYEALNFKNIAKCFSLPYQSINPTDKIKNINIDYGIVELII